MVGYSVLLVFFFSLKHESTPQSDVSDFEFRNTKLKELSIAIERKDYDLVAEVIAHYPEIVNEVDSLNNATILGYCVLNDDVNSASFLLEKGADPSIGKTIEMAAKTGKLNFLDLFLDFEPEAKSSHESCDFASPLQCGKRMLHCIC